ncbi:MAG: ribonuclease III [Phenylobacterium sp.]
MTRPDRRKAAVAALEARIGHVFADRDLLERALTHASVGNGGAPGRDNERLEFLGDRVLNLLAAEHLFAAYPTAREGDLARRLNRLVNSGACAEVAREVGLSDALRLDPSATRVGARESERVLGDACEALLAALYLDAGPDVARAFFRSAWAGLVVGLDREPERDAKTRLQEWAMGLGLPPPDYVVVRSEGPPHDPRFTIEARLPGHVPASGAGRSKREAEKAAAAKFLEREKIQP